MRSIGLEAFNNLSEEKADFLHSVYLNPGDDYLPNEIPFSLTDSSISIFIDVKYAELSGQSRAFVRPSPLLKEILRCSYADRMFDVLEDVKNGGGGQCEKKHLEALETLGFVSDVWDVYLTDDGAELLREFRDLSLVRMEAERFEWAKETFPGATAKSAIAHLRKELIEIEENLDSGTKDVTEYSDALMLVMEAAARDGFTASDVLKGFRDKHEINKTRKWEQHEDGAYYHKKEVAKD